MSSLLEHYGGFSKVQIVISDFYESVLDDNLLKDYFVHRDMNQLVDHQTKFIASIMGGFHSITDKKLKNAHANLQIDVTAFDKILTILEKTLHKHEFSRQDINKLMDVVISKKPFIVTI
jgi:hemoglobin